MPFGIEDPLFNGLEKCEWLSFCRYISKCVNEKLPLLQLKKATNDFSSTTI
jgi:hypothetical protein